MEELYTESFFKTPPEIELKNETPSIILKENKPDALLAKPIAKSLVEIYETVNQMNFYLDQLEKALFNDFKNFSDFQFIFSKIRAKLKQKNTEGSYELLTELEELLDLS